MPHMAGARRAPGIGRGSMMIPDGLELTRLFERSAPDGTIFLAGMLADAAVMVVKDQNRPGVWRLILTDPSRVNNRNDASAARAIAAPAAVDEHGWYQGDGMNDDVDDEWLKSQQEGVPDVDKS